MQTLISRSTGWVSLLLIAHFLVGCADTVQARPDLPPIYLEQSDVQCMALSTKRQIVQHNCKVDFDPKYCNTKDK